MFNNNINVPKNVRPSSQFKRINDLQLSSISPGVYGHVSATNVFSFKYLCDTVTGSIQLCVKSLSVTTHM